MSSDKEKYYTEVIAPKLGAIAKECWENGISILAVCDFGKASGKTLSISPGSSLAFRLVEAAYECNGNVDALMVAIERHAMKWGHSSVYLHLRGIPETPSVVPLNVEERKEEVG